MVGKQRVPRAALTALIELVRSLEVEPHIIHVEVWSDCKMVVDRFNRGKESCMASKLSGFWRDFWKPDERFQVRNVHLVVRRVEVHCADEEIVPK